MREPRERRAQVRGNEMVWFEWGPRDAPLVVLAHATGFHARCWDATIQALGDGHRVVAMDQRGHGRSGKQGPFEWTQFGADLAELLNLLDARGAIGVGHSMGGHALVQAAALDGERFTRLVLVDPVIMEPAVYVGWSEDRPFNSAEEHPVARRRADFASWQAMHERFRDRLPFSRWRPEVLRDYCRHGVLPKPDGAGVTLACPPVVESSIYLGSGGTDVHALLRELPHPTLVIRARKREVRQGEMDFSGSPTWEGVAAALPNGQDLYRPDLTHFVPMQAPELVALAIQDPEAAARTRPA